jgi:ABC-type transporter Mla MlaB component
MTTDDRRGDRRGPGPATPRSPQDAVILALTGPVERDRIATLCEHARTLIARSAADTVVCDLSRLGRPDAVTVEALARLQLEARRLGRRIVFRDACGELRELVAFVGLDRALPCEQPEGP